MCTLAGITTLNAAHDKAGPSTSAPITAWIALNVDLTDSDPESGMYQWENGENMKMIAKCPQTK